MLGDILGFLGLGGAAALVGLTYFLPGVLPGAVAKGVVAMIEALAAGAGWLLGTLADGAQYIAGRNSAVITLAVAIAAGVVIGERTDPLAALLPAWMRSASAQAGARGPHGATYWPEAPEEKPAAPRRSKAKPATDPLRDFFCQLGGC
jgi:hypothetical protein